jgi:hypothetical protein
MADIQKIILPTKRTPHERLALEPFEEVLTRYTELSMFTKQFLTNRLVLNGVGYFQFGDLRVDTSDRHIILEVDHGGVTNLVKYRYCIDKNLIQKPVALLQLYRMNTQKDYATHVELWKHLNDGIFEDLKDKFSAHIFTYRPKRLRSDLAAAIAMFEGLLAN